MTQMVPLEALAQVSLGYKSLQNDFFYLNKDTIRTYKMARTNETSGFDT
jgi:hypothetical protein